MVIFKDYLHANLICFLNSKDRNSALRDLVNHAIKEGVLGSNLPFLDAVLQREAIVTTGIGLGIAIPHAKLPHLHSFFVVMGILQEGVNWKALDNLPVRIIFLIGGPENQQTKYLKILSSMTHFIKEKKNRRKILTAKDPQEILQFFETTFNQENSEEKF